MLVPSGMLFSVAVNFLMIAEVPLIKASLGSRLLVLATNMWIVFSAAY